MEYWRDIKGYEGLYQVSNYGRVRSVDRTVLYEDGRIGNFKGKIRKIKINNSGYCLVILNNHKSYLVHRLVAEAFIPNPNNLPCVNHKDEDKQNNFVFVNEDETVDLEKSNLEWCTQKYNCNYGSKQITNITSKHNKPILQFDLENKLIKEWVSSRQASRELGYSQGNISSCCNGKDC